MPEKIDGGFLPYLSNIKYAKMIVAITRAIPISAVHKNLSIPAPASSANCDAYTTITNVPENCWKAKNALIMASGL